MSGPRETQHRFDLDDAGPKGVKVTPAQAFDILRSQGLDDVTADDLEVYRLVMSPASFRLLEARLAKALACHADQPDETPPPIVEAVPLPFGTDITNGFEFHDTCDVPGRLQLIEGREFSAWGIVGRLRFRRGVTTDTGCCWVEGWDEDGRCCSFTFDRIRTVHRTTTMPVPRERRRGRRVAS